MFSLGYGLDLEKRQKKASKDVLEGYKKLETIVKDDNNIAGFLIPVTNEELEKMDSYREEVAGGRMILSLKSGKNAGVYKRPVPPKYFPEYFNSEKLFVYGALDNIHLGMSYGFSLELEAKKDVLEGYEKLEKKLDKDSYYVLKDNPNSSVEGLVISISPEGLPLLIIMKIMAIPCQDSIRN